MSDKSGCVSRSMTTKAINTIMTERIWISRVASEIVFQLMFSDTGAPLHDERVTKVRKKPNLHPEHPPARCHSRNADTDRVLHVTLYVVHEARGCTRPETLEVLCGRTDSVPARDDTDLVLSALTSVTSPMRHTRVPRKS